MAIGRSQVPKELKVPSEKKEMRALSPWNKTENAMYYCKECRTIEHEYHFCGHYKFFVDDHDPERIRKFFESDRKTTVEAHFGHM